MEISLLSGRSHSATSAIAVERLCFTLPAPWFEVQWNEYRACQRHLCRSDSVLATHVKDIINHSEVKTSFWKHKSDIVIHVLVLQTLQWHPVLLKVRLNGGAWWAAVHGVAKSPTRLSDFTFTFHLQALEKEMATHSSVLAWRIPGTAEPGGLPSMGSHRVGHDWSDLAAAAANSYWPCLHVVLNDHHTQPPWPCSCSSNITRLEGFRP